MTSKRAVELKLQSLNFPSYFAFVPTAEDMKLSPRAFHRKMCSGQEVAGHAGFYVMVQYSVSQLCNELQKLESYQPMNTVRPRCTRVKPGKGGHSGDYYKLPQIGRMGAIEELS